MGWAMRRLRPGGFAWLVAHELRLSLRARTSKLVTRWVGYALLAVYVGGALLAAKGLQNVPIPPSPMALVVVLTASILLLSFMTTQAVLASQRTLYEAGDLDLLFSAPLPPRTVLLAKLFGIAGTITLTFAALLLPFAISIAALGHPRLFGVPLLLAALALIAACLGLALTLVIARIAGPRAARTVGQIAAAVMGGAVFLVSQLINGSKHRQSSAVSIFQRLRADGVVSSPLGSLPGRAAFADPSALAILLGGAIVLFVVTGLVFNRLFRRGVAEGGQRLSRRTASTRGIARHFRTSVFGAMFAKEVTLLIRDPALAFQIVLRLIYLAPLMLVGFRSTRDLPLGPSLAFISVAIAGQLVGSFAWLALSAEDAPDLLAVAPIDRGEVARTKLVSALAIAAPFAVLLPIAIATETLLGALVTLLATAAGGVAAGLIELKLGKPGERGMLNKRRPGSFVTRILTLLVTIALGGGTAVAVFFIERWTG